MILLQEPPLIFLKARKVAGTSFEIALSKFANQSSIITPIAQKDEVTRQHLGFRGPQNYTLAISEVLKKKKNVLRTLYHGERPKKFYNHIPAEVARLRLGEEAWQNSCKVSIVRNPFDQLVSMYFWEFQGKPERPPFQSWISRNPFLINSNYEQTHIEGQCIVDSFIRYENLETDIRDLERRLPQLSGLWHTFSSLSAKSGISPKVSSTASFFDDAPRLIEAVKFFNKDIISRFGYDLH